MAIVSTMVPFESQMWPQGDIRDPLGVWGSRVSVTGDATGDTIKVTVDVPAARRAAYVYTHLSCEITQLTGAVVAASAKVRILSGWPNTDAQAGVNAYSMAKQVAMSGSDTYTAPFGMPNMQSAPGGWILPNERYILCFDPRPGVNTDLAILELELLQNTNLLVYAFQAYGYYWDRSVMQAPGGPRHPGAN